uniref:Protein kinase domain-containing protein n=1 Tax=Meloidogyne enterolobii TaxID=390850 RepID=A0A6V7TJ06_MELEN|nr:unnamed protein product [Meloidogyne enterolobii]
MVNPAGYDAKVQQLLEECKISTKLVNYIENFNYPYVNDVQLFYEQLLKIGQGTFGEVFKARCKRTGQFVALKKILMENEKEGFPITALREIKMLKLLRHPNITELIDVCTCKQKNARERFSFYLVFTFCEHDLAGLLSNQKIKFSLVEIKTMAKHILEGLNKIHKSNILHRDMKSANVLITAGGVLKLADFGLARLMIKQQDYRYTNRVVTLWYRPPELLLGSSSYGPSIDIWGAGCIISELWTRSPILQGNTEQEQLIRIAKLCGSINCQTWEGCEALPLYSKLKASGSEMHSALNNALPQNYPRRVREKLLMFLEHNEQAISLIDQMLSLPPERRPTAEEALDHNFFWEAPLSAENIKGLVDKLKGTNLFEYTSGCGAHANRKRPIAPAAPTHNSSGSSQGSQPMHQQPRKPLNAFQQQPKSQHSNFGQHHQQFSGSGGTQRIKGNNAVAGQAPVVRMQSSQQRQHQPLSKTISSFSQQQSSSQSFSQQVQQASTSGFAQGGFGNQAKRKRLVPPETNEINTDSLQHSSNPVSYQHHQKPQHQFFQHNQQSGSSNFSNSGRKPNRPSNQHSYNAQAPPQSLQNANKPPNLFSQQQQQQLYFAQQSAPRMNNPGNRFPPPQQSNYPRHQNDQTRFFRSGF